MRAGHKPKNPRSILMAAAGLGFRIQTLRCACCRLTSVGPYEQGRERENPEVADRSCMVCRCSTQLAGIRGEQHGLQLMMASRAALNTCGVALQARGLLLWPRRGARDQPWTQREPEPADPTALAGPG